MPQRQKPRGDRADIPCAVIRLVSLLREILSVRHVPDVEDVQSTPGALGATEIQTVSIPTESHALASPYCQAGTAIVPALEDWGRAMRLSDGSRMSGDIQVRWEQSHSVQVRKPLNSRIFSFFRNKFLVRSDFLTQHLFCTVSPNCPVFPNFANNLIHTPFVAFQIAHFHKIVCGLDKNLTRNGIAPFGSHTKCSLSNRQT